MKTYTIKVTQEDIDNGKPSSCRYCPVAQAIKRTYKVDERSVWVGNNFIRINGKKYYTSEQIDNFIDRFDDGVPVKPFEFELEEAPLKGFLENF